MPHYYFHIHNGSGLIPDEEGQELAGRDEARATAVVSIRSILADEVDSGQLDLNGFLEVTDEDGALVMRVAFSEALAIRPAPGIG